MVNGKPPTRKPVKVVDNKHTIDELAAQIEQLKSSQFKQLDSQARYFEAKVSEVETRLQKMHQLDMVRRQKEVKEIRDYVLIVIMIMFAILFSTFAPL